ncbi:ABC-three component system middle component 6 [Vibrio splendidus]
MKLDYSLLNVTAQVIACLLERPFVVLETLVDYARNSSEQINESDVILAVTFLYATGKVEYFNESMEIRLVRSDND